MRAREEEARARRANAEVTVLNPLAPSIRTSAPLVPVSSPPTHLGRVVRADEGLLRRRGAVTSTASAAFDGEGASSAAAAALANRCGRGDAAGALRIASEDPGSVNGIVDEDGRRPLHVAAMTGHAGVVEALLSRGAEPDARCRRGRTALHEAAKGGHAACARAILIAHKEYGSYYGATGRRADANARDASGKTPLHEARSRETIEALLREGADGSIRQGDGSNAVHLACDRADGWAVEALLGCGADCDARDGVGRTALHRARDARSAAALCACGADVDVVNDDGYTPLHIAAMEGKPEIVAPLVNAGARLRARTRKRGSIIPGATAADLAVKFSHDEVVRLLEESKQFSREAYLSTLAVNHNEERFQKQMRRASERRVGLVWGLVVACVAVLFALLVGHFWFAEAKKELKEWRKIRASKERARAQKLKQQEAAKKAELKRKLKAEADAKAWQESARQHVERVLRCGVHGTLKEGVKKGGVHRCVLFGQDGQGLSKEASAACGVCVDFLQELRERLDQSRKTTSEAEVDLQLNDACEKSTGRSVKVCDALLASRKDVNRQMAFGAPPAKICERVGAKNPELCAIKPPKEGDLSSDGKGDIAAREAFKKLSVFTHPDKHDNSEASTEAFKMLNTARAYMDAKAKLNAKRRKGKAKGAGDPR